MPIVTQIYSASSDVEDALARYLGVPLGLLDDVAMTWGIEVISANRFRPPTGPGFSGWDRGTEVLREGARRYGYDPVDEHGVPLAVNRGRGAAICLVAGTDGAGDRARNPTTKYPRGTVGRQVVMNQLSLTFNPETSNDDAGRDDVDLETWIVLPCFSWAENLVRYEISCAATISSDGYITTWLRRIVPGPVEPLRRRHATPEQSDEIDIPVRPR